MDLTKQQIFFKKSMGILAIVFLVCAILFVAIPDQIVQLNNVFARLFNLTQASVVSETPIQNLQPFPFEKGKTPEGKDFIAPHRLWVSLAFSMMIMISFICLMNFLDPKKYIGWTPILILSKFVSSTTGLIAFWAGERYFADLIVFITDFPLFVFIVIIYWRAKSSAEQY